MLKIQVHTDHRPLKYLDRKTLEINRTAYDTDSLLLRVNCTCTSGFILTFCGHFSKSVGYTENFFAN